MDMKNLEKYLEIEGLLNSFFTRLDYCPNTCFLPKAGNFAPSPGCCRDRYYKKFDLDHPAFGLLKKEREKYYGRPEDYAGQMRISPCEYHTLQGCRLKTHKSPVCLGFMCRESITCMRSRYGIYIYDYLGVHYALEWILTGDFSDRDYEAFRTDCADMIEKLENQRSEVGGHASEDG